MNITANDLINDKEAREKLVERVEVLDRVKDILLIPGTDVATITEIADFYKVSVDSIQKIYQRNTTEIDMDGIHVVSAKELIGLKCPISRIINKTQFKTVISYENGKELTIPNRGIKVFPRRAILRIGMMVQDSEEADELRTQLLNIEEKVSAEQKIEDILSEEQLLLNVGRAYATKDVNELIMATSEYNRFQNRRIAGLQESNRALANGILEWEDRSRINFAVRKVANLVHKPYGYIWKELYTQLKGRYHMDLQARGKKPWIQYVSENEWQNVIKSFYALCKCYGLEPADMFHDLEAAEEEEKAEMAVK